MTRLGREAMILSRYGAAGLASNLVLYLAFLALIWAGTPALAAAGLCYVGGVALSYALNRGWTFASAEGHAHDLPRFLAAYGIGLASTVATLALLLRWLPPETAQILNIGITAGVIYCSLRLLRFGGHGGHAG